MTTGTACTPASQLQGWRAGPGTTCTVVGGWWLAHMLLAHHETTLRIDN